MSARSTVKSIQDLMRQDVGVDGDAQRLSQLCWMFFLKIIDDQDQQLELMHDGYKSPIPPRLQWRSWAADPEGDTGDTLMAFVNDDLFPALKELPALGKQANRARVIRGLFGDAYNYMKSGHLPYARNSASCAAGLMYRASSGSHRAVDTCFRSSTTFSMPTAPRTGCCARRSTECAD